VRYFSLFGRGCSAELTKVNVKEFLYLLMFDPLLLAYLLVSQPLLHGFKLSGGAVFICSGNVDGVVAHQPALTLIYVCRKDASDDIA